MTVSINGTGGLTFSDSSIQNTAATGFGFKNRIINGAMMIDQRNAGASVTITTNTYTIDRWQGISPTGSSKFSIRQMNSATSSLSNYEAGSAPDGFINSLKVTSLTALSLGSTDRYAVYQGIEGLNIADLGWGTSSAKTVTLSFWVKCSLTGTFGGALINDDGNYSYPFTYTISAANTWEQKTVTISGPTSGTWKTTNITGINIHIGLSIGSTYQTTGNQWTTGNYRSPTGCVSVLGTNGATFYITGVQLEKGSTATSFDYRPYGTELQLAQRYYFRDSAVSSLVYNGSGSYSSYQFKVSMRAAPTVTAIYTANSVSTEGFYSQSGGVTGSTVTASAEL